MMRITASLPLIVALTVSAATTAFAQAYPHVVQVTDGPRLKFQDNNSVNELYTNAWGELKLQANHGCIPGFSPCLRYTWSKLSGPGVATFSPNNTTQEPLVSFNLEGTYVVRVTVNDDHGTMLDRDLTLLVIEPPMGGGGGGGGAPHP